MTPDTLLPIASRHDFRDAVRDAIAAATERGAAEIVMVDPDFDDWPLDERSLVEALQRWATSSRRCTVVAGRFEALQRRAPRFVEWRRQWSHVVSCRSSEDVDGDSLPTLLLVPGRVVVRLDDRLRHRGIVSAKAVDQVAARETIDALLQRSVEAFPATTLGL